jgi:hypothetical protein
MTSGGSPRSSPRSCATPSLGPRRRDDPCSGDLVDVVVVAEVDEREGRQHGDRRHADDHGGTRENV